jgi:hypothetical protein
MWNFYMVESTPGWFQLLWGEKAYCVSAGDDLNLRIEVMKNNIIKYKTDDRFSRAMAECMRNSPGSDIGTQINKERIATSPYGELVADAIADAMDIVRRNSIQHKNQQKKVLVPLKKITPAPVPEPPKPAKPALKKLLPQKEREAPKAAPAPVAKSTFIKPKKKVIRVGLTD